MSATALPVFPGATDLTAARDLGMLATRIAAAESTTDVDATIPFDEFTRPVTARADGKLTGQVVVTLL